MGKVANVLLCSFVVVVAHDMVTLEGDRPFLRVQHSHPADLKCCYTTRADPVKFTWVRRQLHDSTNMTNVEEVSDLVTVSDHVTRGVSDKWCGTLTFKSVQLEDSAVYMCLLNLSSSLHLFTHGTYLRVYKPMEKIINLSEITKNKILIAEGFLLLLCVILPSAILLCQSKRLSELEKKKLKKEEENIYQGLNLDDCSTYDQIERSQGQGPYQDVGNIMEEEEPIQLEKP